MITTLKSAGLAALIAVSMVSPALAFGGPHFYGTTTVHNNRQWQPPPASPPEAPHQYGRMRSPLDISNSP
jgi:hypothetical protein